MAAVEEEMLLQFWNYWTRLHEIPWKHSGSNNVLCSVTVTFFGPILLLPLFSHFICSVLSPHLNDSIWSKEIKLSWMKFTWWRTHRSTRSWMDSVSVGFCTLFSKSHVDPYPSYFCSGDDIILSLPFRFSLFLPTPLRDTATDGNTDTNPPGYFDGHRCCINFHPVKSSAPERSTELAQIKYYLL